jgi:surfeit locus 1 family protein
MAAPSAASKVVGKNLGTSGKVFFGSLCVGTFGLGCWQLERLLGKWDAIEDREQQLKLDPIVYGSNIFSSNSSSSSSSMNKLVGDDKLHDQTTQQQLQPYRRRLLRGRFRHDKEVLVGPRGAPPGVRMPVSGLSAKSSSKTKTTVSGMQPGPQGFYVLTPMEVSIDETGTTAAAAATSNSAAPTTVWINRGWVPKTLVPGADRPYYKNDPVQKAQIDRALREQPAAWNRPIGIIDVRAVMSQAESE